MCDIGKAISRAFTPPSPPQANIGQTLQQLPGITNPTGVNVNNAGVVTQSPVEQQNIAQLQSTFGQEAQDIATLRGTVTPGFSSLRQAGLNAIESQYQSTLSTLQQSLAQRRILGSSFADSQISQVQAQEAQDKANFESQAYLAELQSNFNLLQAQYTAQTNQYTTAISQSNIDSTLAASLVASNNSIAGQIAAANAQLSAKSQAGAGSFFGSVLGLGTGTANSTLGGSAISSGFSSLTSGLSGLFGGAGATAAGSTIPTIFGDPTEAALLAGAL